VENGADIYAASGGYGNVLQVAALEGNELIVCYLLGKASGINSKGGCYGNALQPDRVEGS
jgi:hypothetical protein